MFDHCDTDTLAIVDAALGEARRRSHNWLGTEHVLLALAQRRELLPSGVASHLPDAAAVAAALDSHLDRAPRPDADLLKVVGIDLDEVRTAVRQSFGDAAVEDLGRRRVHQPWQPWRRPRRRCMSILAGSMRVAPRLKQSFERARQDSDDRKLKAIDPAALLLGVVEVDDAMANEILHALDVDRESLRRALRDRSG
jgi:ATP-dependent Clp protease ATP-binding subunit ClpA